MASIDTIVASMTTPATRKRIHVTETPRLSAILERQSMPGEPKSATLVRLVERADTFTALDADFMIFDQPGPVITSAQVMSLLDADDADSIAATHP